MQSNPKEIDFYAIHETDSKDFVMEMMIGHRPEGSADDIQFYKFEELSLQILIPGFENLKLFRLSLKIHEDKVNEVVHRYIDTKGGRKQIWDYQIKVTNGSYRLSRGCYYEEIGKFRKIISKKSNYIFDLHIIANENYYYYKDSRSGSIHNFLDQTLCYLIAGLETKKFGTILGFIDQHQNHFRDIHNVDAKQLQTYYNTIKTYFERKTPYNFDKDFDALTLFVCLFGLLPEKETLALPINHTRLFTLIKAFENHIEKLVELKDQKPNIFRVLSKGLAILSVLEVKDNGIGYWMSFLQKTHDQKKIIQELIVTFLRLAMLTKIDIRKDKFKELQRLQNNLLMFYPKGLILANSLNDFAKLMKHDVILPKFQELALQEGKKGDKEHEEMLDGNNVVLPEILSDAQQKIIRDLNDILNLSLEEFLKKKTSPYMTNLEELSLFFQELAHMPNYLQLIFTSNQTLPAIIRKTLEGSSIYEDKDLDWMFNVLKKYYHPILLFVIHVPDLLEKMISNSKISTTKPLYFKFFALFITGQDFTYEEYKAIALKWSEKIYPYPIDRLLENIDELCNSFSGEDKLADAKKELIVESMMTLLKNTSFNDKLKKIIDVVKNEQVLRGYENLVKEEIARKKENLKTKSYANSLLALYEISKSYPGNSLIERLIDFCLSLFPQLKREDILVSLFENPDRYSLLNFILTEQAFKDTKIFKEVNLHCCSILDDLQDANLEWNWLLLTEKLYPYQKGYLYEQLNIVINQNDIKVRETDNKLDIVKLFENYKEEWSKKLSLIDSVRDFLEIYCAEKEDAKDSLDILNKTRDKMNDKKLKNLAFPKELEQFIPYAKKLSPFKDLVSFQKWRTLKIEQALTNTCLEAANYEIENFRQYIKYLKELLGDTDNKTADNISCLFSEVNDIDNEIQLLSKVLDKDLVRYLSEILTYLKEQANYKRTCRGLKICVEYFQLDTKALDFIEAGCSLSSTSQIKTFHSAGKSVHEKLSFDKNRHICNILAEFAEAADLLKFTLARNIKSEVDFMKEAVNDYDESHISTQTIFDFTNFWSFIMEIQTNLKEKTVEYLFEKVRQLSDNKLYIDIYENFKASKINFEGIKNLYLELTHKEEAKRKQIFKIIDNSSLIFRKINKEFDVEVKCSDKMTEKEGLQVFKSVDISELRDRAHLIVFTEQKKINNKEGHNYHQEELDKFKAFCSLADVIYQLLRILNKLNFNGYPELSNLKVNELQTHVVETVFTCKQSGFKPLYNLKIQLEAVLAEWNTCVIDLYTQHYELTYLKGKDFWKVEKALGQPEDKQKSAKGLHFLQYIGKKPLNIDIDVTKTPEERLNTIGKVLTHLSDLPNRKKCPEFKENCMLYVVEIVEKATIKGLISLYLTIEQAIPSSFQLLVCHSSTSWNELVAFAYRCFFNPDNCLFCLIQPERLSFALQDQFSSLIKDLNAQQPKKMFRLGFVTTNLMTHLITSLKVKNQTKILKNTELIDDKKLIDMIQELTQNCQALMSTVTGLGKTTAIKRFVQQENLNYCKIPISGSIDPIAIGKRLLPILSQDRPALCFVLGSISAQDKSLLNEILFSVTVLKSFHYSKNVVELPEDLRVFFEIESSYFESLKDDIEIFGYLNMKCINQMDWSLLDYQSSKIQFICHYLKAFADNSLGTCDITESDVKGKILPEKKCVELLTQVFLKDRNHDFASYTQLNIFIDVLYSLFTSFSHCGFFMYSILSQNANQGDALLMNDTDVITMRLKLVEGLILAADQFTSKSVQSVRTSQKESMKFAQAEIMEKIEIPSNAVVSWDQAKPFTIVFTAYNSPIFIYKSLKDVPQSIKESIDYQARALNMRNDCLMEYKDCDQTTLFKKLASLTTKFFNSGKICLQCFKKYNDPATVCITCNNELWFHKKNEDFVAKIAQHISEDYALTSDNFIKMLLIFSRAQQKIPIIIMGETGCGKTSLIRYLCTRILNDEFTAFPIHAGITSKIILDDMSKYIKEAQELQQENRSLWVFFDEFNTTDSIGLIKEIVCERTMLGKELPENIVFLGACNPWKFKTQQHIFDENVGIKKNRQNEINKGYNLLYTVHPLPETMIEFVWDYGHLDCSTERRYIEAMFSNLTISNNANLKSTAVSLVSAAQQIFKNKNWEGVSSVSLRDVARYKILFEWFATSLTTRAKQNKKYVGKKEEYQIPQQAIILALLHCYYLRISSGQKRTEFLNVLKPLFDKLKMTTRDVQDLLFEEEMDFLRRMEPLPDGIACNQALRENVFALIVCIFNKIPIFICGKPGCSKSLAIQLVFNHLRGKNSIDVYFKTLPELILVSYQGSEYCTSESILGVFNRAEKYLNVTTKNKEILPVIVFDEIGLAEISENNPLKVLHNKLEIENIKVGFVGISNWRLDASKMNRALNLARPDPDEVDLKFTAEAIYNSIGRSIKINKKVIESLAKIYCDLRRVLKKNKKEDIFGLRDYYFLIKGISFDLVSLGKEKGADRKDMIYPIVRKNLKKNFSGIGNEHQFLWKNFCQYMGTPEKEYQIAEPSVRNLIIDNLRDRNSRYLMLITQSDCPTEYIEDIIREKVFDRNDPEAMADANNMMIQEVKDKKEKRREVKMLIGSQMPEDLKNQSYGFKVLSDIILYMEKGYTLIFKKTGHLYSSLYDLFNQSFSYSGDKKYCRVALGALYNPKCLVHNDFHCVIFITENEVKKADPPFLNRFEKYRLKIEDILNDNEKILQKELESWIDSIAKCANEPDLVRPELFFVNYNPEHIFNLILKAKYQLAARQEPYNEDAILQICKQDLIKVASFDFPIMVSLNVDNVNLKNDLLLQYYEEKSFGFKEFCNQILSQKDQASRSIVYTYSQISDNIEYPTKDIVKELKLGNFKAETEILEEVAKYFNSRDRLLVVRVELAKESSHLLFLKHLLINSLPSEQNREDSHLMIIIHLQRFNAGTMQMDTLFQDWQAVMFDSLNSDYLLPFEYLENAQFENLIRSKLVPQLDEILNELFDKCLSKIRYNVDSKDKNAINERRNQLLDDIKHNANHLLGLIKLKADRIIAQDKMNPHFKDWRKYIIGQEWVKATAISPLEALRLVVAKYYESYLMKIVYTLEKDCLLDSYFFAIRVNDENIQKIWISHFEKVNINMNQRLDDQLIEIEFIFGLDFPFSLYEQPKIRQIQEEAEILANQHDYNFVSRVSVDNLTESSFFGDQHFIEILENKNLFNKYFDDQLCLYLRRVKLNLKVEIASLLLDRMFMGDQKTKLKYFLAASKELELILGVVEALITLEDGNTRIFKTSLSGFFDLNETNLAGIDMKKLPRHLLLFKDGVFYNLNQEEFSGLQNGGNLEHLNVDDSKNPFIYFFFANIIDEISCCDYLSRFNRIKDVKSVFKLIEDKIIKTKFLPDNLEVFRPWADVMQFIQTYDINPNERFKLVLAEMKKFEKAGLFTSPECIHHLIDFLKRKTDYVKNLDKLEKEKKVLKLQTQLYKNLVSLFNEEFFDEAFTLIHKEPQLWRFSSKIIDVLDDYTALSSSIQESDGRLDKINDKSSLTILENILESSPKKIAVILANKIFITFETENHTRYKEFLTEKFENFKDNVIYFQNSIEKLTKKDNKDKDKELFVSFLGVAVWLKVYLCFYSMALEKENNDLEILKDIDGILDGDSPGLSTLKLYILKNLKLKHNKSFNALQKDYSQRVVKWIKPFIEVDPTKRKNLNITPLLPVDKPELAKQVDELLQKIYNLNVKAMEDFLALCIKADQDYTLSLCIYSWFVRLYLGYLEKGFITNQAFVNLMNKYQQDLSKHLGKQGCQLIFLLLKNFDQESFFRLNENLNDAEIYQRLVALNILISFTAQQFSGSALSSFMFDNCQPPEDLSSHLNEQCLFGQLENNFIVNNMRDTKVKIEERLKKNLIYPDAKYIYKCSKKCDFLFYFDGCGRPMVQEPKKFCNVCGEEVGANGYNVLLPRHEKMTIEEGFKYIDNYIQKFNERIKKGYLINYLAGNAKIDTKEGMKPITFRTLHFLLHTAIFGLYEARFISRDCVNHIISIEENINGPDYFKRHFLQDYQFIGELLGVNEPFIWLYHILLNFKLLITEKYQVTSVNALTKLETTFEEKLILPSIQSVNTVIQEYHQRYISYVQTQNDENIVPYIDELNQNHKKYPFLEFFSYMKNPTFEDFHTQFSLLVGNGTHFPLLSFVLKKYEELANTSSLPTIVEFTNYLKKKFDFRISRDKASTTPMKELCKEDPEMAKKFEDFKKKWNSLNLQSVRVGCQEKKFQQMNDDSVLSLLLPNTHKDESGILLTGTMSALANLQNEFIYLTKLAIDPSRTLENVVEDGKDSMDLIQTVKSNHIINIDRRSILMDIIKNGYIHNYEYGKGNEIVYDFEEIESRLYEYANGKKLLDNEKFLLMNYQFELYPESASIITDIRRRNPQGLLSQEHKAQYKRLLKDFSKKDLIDYLGSLDYVFTYLCNVKDNVDRSIQEFCITCISNYQDLNKHVIKKEPFSKIQLKYIIDLYETLEEVVFDEALQDFIRPEFVEKISEDEKGIILEKFDKATLNNPKEALCHKLRETDRLIKVLKRIIVRVLGAQVDLENRLLEYFIREDMWSQDVDINEIANVELNDEIKLKHCYIILKHLDLYAMKFEPAHKEVKPAQILDQNEDDEYYRAAVQVNKPQSKGPTRNRRDRKAV